ncbi:flavodoxin [Helicobacter canadensis]|uniref:Flavodoxin n=1 Tax=Helicobacter canadensis MIT 98-5491 TaxID=537970 RepID=C5ZY17_9HELI|nr:flavodoxin [Helicobacter canadensis]EES90035.1 flavodoxin FldA [Helicobacter canadensis MIT 98-5491]EFR49185.1 flavodoxin [Helicobacter canadensis MIT 98-5491]STP02465.1 flavodoxin [Helicobacter canadensis]
MSKIGLFYGSDGGNTQRVAEKIATNLREKHSKEVEVFDVAKASKEDLKGFTNLILATPTYGSGEIQSDWEEFLTALSPSDFEGKVVALVGLGDQDTYSDTFSNGVFEIYNQVSKTAKIIGKTSTQGYEYEESNSAIEGEFIGLILDEDNQEDLTDARIEKWCDSIAKEFI